MGMNNQEDEQHKEFRINRVKAFAEKEIQRIKENRNIFGYTRPNTVTCSLFQVCEFAGSKEDGGRCYRCGYNQNITVEDLK